MRQFELWTAFETGWWLAFFAATGLCIGSFLNAVIYRLPRNISIRSPRWSFCPGCESRIHWYDNLPLFSYLMLRGRCRHCGTQIALRYPLVEVLAAMVMLMLFDAFFIGRTQSGLASDLPGITWRMSVDWPIFLGHVVLFASLWAMSAIDMESYWVDIRFTTLATVLGFFCHAIWTPATSDAWSRPSDPLAAVALAMTLVVLVTMAIMYRIYRTDEHIIEESESGDVPAESEPAAEGLNAETVTRPAADPTDVPSATSAGLARLPGLMAVTVSGMSLLVVFLLAFSESAFGTDRLPSLIRWSPGLVILFGLIVAGLSRSRESDQEIREAIESESSSARRQATLELLVLLPAVLTGLLVGWMLWHWPESHTGVAKFIHWSPLESWRPFYGLGTAAAGYVIGGGIGWLVRIVATLVMGKEAFGAGDIHMMAAAGCVAGWPVVLVGFILCSFLALLGWLLAIPFKRSQVIALGPWLTLAFLIVVLLYNPIMESQLVQNVVYVYETLIVNEANITGSH